jgi:hypothetical protein
MGMTSFKRVGVVAVLLVACLTTSLSGCAAPAVKTSPRISSERCRQVPAVDFTSFWITVGRLGKLYEGRAFSELELSLSCLVDSDGSFSTGQSGSSAAYWFFRTQMPAPGMDVEGIRLINAWRTQSPTSIFSEFAKLRQTYAMAWQFRGSSPTKDVPAEGMRMFSAMLSGTAESLELASPALKETTLWHNLMLATVLDLGERERARAVFEAAVAKWPRHFDFYEVALSRQVPRWGGSWRTVDESIRAWSQRIKSSEGDSMYARLYVSVLADTGISPDETAMDEPHMRRSLDELVRRYPSPKFFAFAASLACFRGEKGAYETALQKLDRTADGPAYWIGGTDPDSCARKFNRSPYREPPRVRLPS